MKRNRFGLALLSAIILMSTGCKKDLDQQPTDTFSDANAFLTITDVQQGTYEAYVRYGTYVNTMYINALLSDEARLGLDNAGQGTLSYRLQFGADPTTGGDVISLWGGYYAVIDQVNRVLPFVPTVTATAAQEPRRNILKAQLLALRGISHFGLLQAYSKNYDPAELGVPVMTVSNPLGQPARNTMGEVMTAIETDLSDAKALLPAVTPATFSDTVINKVNIAAYQARIALYKGDYAAAVTYSTEVINSAVKPLVSGAAFAGIWTDENANETLFRIRYPNSATVGSLWTTTGGQYYIEPSTKLVASYTSNDVRQAAYIGQAPAGNNYVNKFYTSSRGGRVVDLKAMRIAEMYLIRAEALAKQAAPNLAGATADLNTLRANRISGYADETFGGAPALISAILFERFKELAFEGHRYFDLKRNNLPLVRDANDASAAWITLPAGDNRFVLPIPRQELNANKNIVQNPGYN